MNVMNTKENCFLLRDIQIDEVLGVRLFGKVYQEVSAFVELGRNGLKLRLFDSCFAPEVLEREWEAGARFALYTNHPEGDMRPREQDLRNLALMPERTEMYIVYEDECVRWEG